MEIGNLSVVKAIKYRLRQISANANPWLDPLGGCQRLAIIKLVSQLIQRFSFVDVLVILVPCLTAFLFYRLLTVIFSCLSQDFTLEIVLRNSSKLMPPLPFYQGTA